MQKIKFLSKNTIKIANTTYQGYLIGDLPNSFGFIYNENKEQYGKSHWFNYKVLTYIEKTLLPW